MKRINLELCMRLGPPGSGNGLAALNAYQHPKNRGTENEPMENLKEDFSKVLKLEESGSGRIGNGSDRIEAGPQINNN